VLEQIHNTLKQGIIKLPQSPMVIHWWRL